MDPISEASSVPGASESLDRRRLENSSDGTVEAFQVHGQAILIFTVRGLGGQCLSLPRDGLAHQNAPLGKSLPAEVIHGQIVERDAEVAAELNGLGAFFDKLAHAASASPLKSLRPRAALHMLVR